MGGAVVEVRDDPRSAFAGQANGIALGHPPRRLFHQLCSVDLPKSPLSLHLSGFRYRRDRTVAGERRGMAQA
jgi:hypothetical protein